MAEAHKKHGAPVESPEIQNPVKLPIIADLNDPPISDGEDAAAIPDPSPALRVNDGINLVSTALIKDVDMIEEDLDHQCQGVPLSREEKVSNLKTGLVHAARKMPKNAYAHFLLGLMYQRLAQPQKAILAYEKSSEILLRGEEEIRRPELLSLVLTHHSQSILQASTGDASEKELGTCEMEEILLKLNDSVQSDAKHAAVWNTLGLVLLKTGRFKSAISIFSSILAIASDNLDSIANLSISYIHSGEPELSAKCLQELILKDQNHPAALMNYASFLLYKYGSTITGSKVKEGNFLLQSQAVAVAKECLLSAVRTDPRAGALWLNLSNAYYVAGEHINTKKCLEQAAILEPYQMPSRFAIAVHRVKDAERSQEQTEQLVWAANEMASIVKEGDPATTDPAVTWAGLAMIHRAQHGISEAFNTIEDLDGEERALCTLKQAVEEDPDDAVSWNQLGLNYLCNLQFKTSLKFLKASIVRCKDCCYAWSNLGISLQLSDNPSYAEKVYKQALSLASTQQMHVILSNLGNLYRQQRRFELAKAVFAKSLELCPGYAPAYNNLGLVFVAEGQWVEATDCFLKALESDPILDAAKSNAVKAMLCH